MGLPDLSSDIWLPLSHHVTPVEVYRLLGCGCRRLTQAVLQGVESLNFEAEKFSSLPFLFTMSRLRSISVQMRQDALGYPLSIPNGKLLPTQAQNGVREIRFAFAQSFWLFPSSKASFTPCHAFPNLTHLSVTECHLNMGLHFFKQLPKGLIFLEIANSPINPPKPLAPALALSDIVPHLPQSLESLHISPVEGLNVSQSPSNLSSTFWPPNLTSLRLEECNNPNVIDYLPPLLKLLHLTVEDKISRTFPLEILPKTMTSIDCKVKHFTGFVGFSNATGLPLHPGWKHFGANFVVGPSQSPWDVISWLNPGLESFTDMSKILANCFSWRPQGAQALRTTSSQISPFAHPLPNALCALENVPANVIYGLPANLKLLSFRRLEQNSSPHLPAVCPFPTTLTSLEHFGFATEEQLQWLRSLTALKHLNLTSQGPRWSIPEHLLLQYLPSSLNSIAFDLSNISSPECLMAIDQACPQLERMAISTSHPLLDTVSKFSFLKLMDYVPKRLKSLIVTVDEAFQTVCIKEWMPIICRDMDRLEVLEVGGQLPRIEREKSVAPEWLKHLPKSLKTLKITLPLSWLCYPLKKRDHIASDSSHPSSSMSDMDSLTTSDQAQNDHVFSPFPSSLTDLHIVTFGYEMKGRFAKMPPNLTRLAFSGRWSQSFDMRLILAYLPSSILHLQLPAQNNAAMRDMHQQYRTRMMLPYFSRPNSSNLLSWLGTSHAPTSSSTQASLWMSPQYFAERERIKAKAEALEQEHQ